MMMLKKLFIFLCVIKSYSGISQCPQFYDYLGTLTTTPLYISCSGAVYNMNLQSNTAFGSYTVNWGDGSPNSSGTYTVPGVIPHTYASTTNSYVLTVTIPAVSCTFTAPVIVERPVAASIQIPTTGVTQACAPQTLIFTNSSTNVSGTTTFTWNFGDGTGDFVYPASNAGATISHLYNKGTVNCETSVTLLGLNACRFGSPSNAVFNPLQIYDLDDAAITPDQLVRCWPDATFQFNNTTARNCVPEGNIFQRQERWNLGNHWGRGQDSIIGWSPWPPTSPISITYTALGSYVVSLLDSNLCGVDPATITVNIVNPPTASLIAQIGNLCQNTTISFTNSAITASTSYQWNFGEGAGFQTLTGTVRTNVYQSPGTYTVILVASLAGANAACTDTSKQVITILASPVSNFSLTPSVGCNSISNVSFTDLSVGAIVWNWTFANGNTSTLQLPPTQNYTLTGTFMPTLVVTASTSCTHISTKTITIRPKPLPAFPSFSACVGSPVSFTNNSTPTSGSNSIISQSWNFGDLSPFSASLTPIHTYTAPVTYTVKLVCSSSFCIDSLSQAITINITPSASFVATPTLGCPPLSVTFTNTSINANNYLWKFTNGLAATSSATNPSYSYSNSTQSFQNYTVTLIAGNGACFDSTKKAVTIKPKPVSNFTTNTTAGCSPLLTTFLNTSIGQSSSFWTFGDGGVSGAPNPSHTYTNNTLFTQTISAQLIVTNSLSCTDTIRKLLTVYADAQPAITMVPSSGCSPIQVGFQSVPGVATYSWSHGDGSPTFTTQTTHNWPYTNTGTANLTYVVTLTAQTTNGCFGTGIGSVTVFYNPISNFTTIPGIGCSPFSPSFSNTSIGQSLNFWTFNNGASSQLLNPSATFTNAPGSAQSNYPVKLKVITSNGCTDSVSNTVSLYPQPKTIFTLDTPACSPKTIKFFSSSIHANSYRWDFGDGTSEITTNSTTAHPYINASNVNRTFFVTLKAISTNNCADSLTIPLIVHPKPEFTIINNPDFGCSPLSVYFDSIGGVKNYQWKYDGISFSSTGGVSNVFENKDPFTRTINIELIARDIYTCADTSTKQIKVFPVPTAKFSANPINVFIPNQPTFFTNESSPDNLNYNWFFGDGNISPDKSPSHTYTSVGEFQTRLVVVNSEGCKDTFDLPNKVTALAESSVETPNAFTPNLNSSPGRIYDPNDTSNDIFHPNIKGTEKYSLSIYSRWGELLFETKDPNEGWDGYYKGNLCTQDVYIWKITATFIDGKTLNKTGDLLLLR
jgi:gliding motility-associated-like protein